MAAGVVIQWREVMTMTKANLRTGMTVQTRDGNWLLVYDGKLVDHIGYLYIAEYTDDFRDENNQSKYDIMKVCAPSNMAYSIDGILENHGEVLWERK